MNKKGVLGLQTVGVVLVSVLILAVIVIAMFLATSNLRDAAESSETSQTLRVNNETVTAVSEPVKTLAEQGRRNSQCTVWQVVNATDGVAITTANYTAATATCTIKYSGPGAGGFNGTNWKVSYNVTYNSPYANEITGNTTAGPINFFKQSGTVFTILGIVLIILAIGIIIYAVSRFGGGSSGVGIGGSGIKLGGGAGVSEDL